MVRLFVLVFLFLTFINEAFAESNKLVADVIFSEAGPHCSFEERTLVASVIYNRAHFKDKNAFGNVKTMEEAVKAPNQFEAYQHDRNRNWRWTQKYKKSELLQRREYVQAYMLSNPDYLYGKDKLNTEVTHFVTKGHSIKGLVNTKYWKLVLVKHTRYLSFYKIVAKEDK